MLFLKDLFNGHNRQENHFYFQSRFLNSHDEFYHSNSQSKWHTDRRKLYTSSRSHSRYVNSIIRSRSPHIKQTRVSVVRPVKLSFKHRHSVES